MLEHLTNEIPGVLWIKCQDNGDCCKQYKKCHYEGYVPPTDCELKFTINVIENHTYCVMPLLVSMHVVMIFLV